MRIFEQIYNGSRTKFGCLKVLKAKNSFYCCSKFQEIWLSLSPSKRLANFFLFQKRINFLKKSSNFNYLSFGSRMQTVTLPGRGLGRRVPSVNLIFDFDIFLNVKGIVWGGGGVTIIV